MANLFHRIVARIKLALGAGAPGLTASLESLEQGKPCKLTPSLSDSILRQVTSNPTPKPDFINFASADWDGAQQWEQQLASQLAGLGHRIFYIQTSFIREKTPQVTRQELNLYLIKLPRLSAQGLMDSPMSMDDIVSLSSSISKLIAAFDIRTAILKVDDAAWGGLAAQISQEYGWRLVYDFFEQTAISPSSFVQPTDDQQELLAQSDLVVFSSVYVQHSLGYLARKHIVLANPEGSEAGLPIDSGLSQPDPWQVIAEALESETRVLFPKISIIVVTFNKLDYTRMCLESVVQNTEYPNYEIVIVDNASVDGSPEYIREFMEQNRDVTFIQNKKNLGFATANNMGANIAGGDYFVFLNNDTIVTPGWLQGLWFCLKKYPSAGMVGSVTNAIGNEAKIDVDYKELSGINLFAARRANKYRGLAFEIQVLALYCAMISRQLYDQLGGLDERYQVGMFEDDDLALKIHKENLTLICAQEVFIHHFHGVSFNQFEDQELQRIFHENKARFEQKWGVVWQPHRNRRHRE